MNAGSVAGGLARRIEKLREIRRASPPATRWLLYLCLAVAICGLRFPLTARAQSPLESTEFVPGSWTVVLLPDTQLYSQDYPGLFTLQTHWIAKNRDKYNIRYAIQLGDITNKSTPAEWERARDALDELDGHVPYAIVPGNHDYKPLEQRISLLSEYFPLSKFKCWPSLGGTMNGDMCNSYHLFTAGGTDWIILALEWAPRDETVQWANEVLAKYPRRTAILATHAYLYDDGTRYDFATKGKSQDHNPHIYHSNTAVNDGEELWQKLVRKNNFALTFSGHVCHKDRVAFLVSKDDGGKTVHQMVVDYQNRKLGGEGYLRILEFLPDNKTVHVKSYSPLYDKYLSDSGNQFSFQLAP